MQCSDWIDRDLYPFRSNYLELPAGRMHYVDEGSGDPVVMVHGNPAWSFLYRSLIRGLSPDFRCVAPDHLGFGLSDKPAGWSHSPEAHASNLSRLIEALGLEDVTLVVQDWGGPIGLSYAIEKPASTSRIVIMNTWMWPVDRDWYYVAFSSFMGGAVGRFLILRFNFFARVVMPMTYGDRRRLTREVHRHYLCPLKGPEERRGSAILPGQITGSTPGLRELWDARAVLRVTPALILWGLKDIAFREKELDVWKSLLTDAAVITLEGVGHFVQEEAPDVLVREVRAFLTQPRDAILDAQGGQK